ncbi:RNA-binding protein Nova [Paragonimus westermani]|uniref:RNA-binding protein Nova n=1 Tax=Paragonimus westermani TaxID=34504 RepID=A0A5J4NUM0_9TREM|nr:RNA-binding protein Nova [Paragonimus westermani]
MSDSLQVRKFRVLFLAAGDVHFKILVPSIAAGAIIGKGGEAITDIQNKTSAKVKMSKANDFYPGTTERVCLIMGTIESILKVFQYISEKIYEKPELLLRTTAKGSRMPAERHKQVKILVPNSTAGIIIGKGGSFIKEVKESTGVFIQVSQKSKELSLAERCVTVAADASYAVDLTNAFKIVYRDPSSLVDNSPCYSLSVSETISQFKAVCIRDYC